MPAFAKKRLADLLQPARDRVQRRAFRPMVEHLRAQCVRRAGYSRWLSENEDPYRTSAPGAEVLSRYHRPAVALRRPGRLGRDTLPSRRLRRIREHERREDVGVADFARMPTPSWVRARTHANGRAEDWRGRNGDRRCSARRQDPLFRRLTNGSCANRPLLLGAIPFLKPS
jgi:hypothetical protein